MNSEWLDRIVAAFGGAAGFMAVRSLSDQHLYWRIIGVGLVIASAWLCAPPRRHKKPLGCLIQEEERQRFIDELSAIYGVGTPIPYPTMWPQGSWDPFGTPVTWCREPEQHEPHLWRVRGTVHAPVLCIGHDCPDAERHMAA